MENYLQILTANIILAYLIATWVYLCSFANKPGNHDMRELAKGGSTGNFIYDYYIGRELNQRVIVPFFGEIDAKAWLEMRPGLAGCMLLDPAYIAKQYRNYVYVTDSILFITAVQSYYILEGQYSEEGILGMMDTTTDGLGFMLSFGDIFWVPFLYLTQCRYLSTYPVQLGWVSLLIVTSLFGIDVSIFRAINSQKKPLQNQPRQSRIPRNVIPAN